MPAPTTSPTGQFASELTPEAIAHRQRDAYRMRLSGAGYDDIAKALAVDRSTARRDVQAAHDAYLKESNESVALVRQQSLARLDVALFAVMPQVRQGKLFAVDRLLAIEERRAKLLGLDAARRVEMTGKDGQPIEADVNIRERYSVPEAREMANEMVRRLQVAERETRRLTPPAVIQAGDERN